MRIKITADSICDLPRDIIERYSIGIIPLYILKDDVPYRDTIDITVDDIFNHVDSGAGVCVSSAVNIADYKESFDGFLKSHDAIIHICISSAFSACCQNARIAAAELENVYVIDSRNLSTGTGHIVLDAAIMAEQGMSPEDIVQKLGEMTAKVEASFVIGTLKYLHKGGRCSSLAALGANVLKLHPCIEVVDGKMDVGKKYRGAFDKSILSYVEDRLSNRTDIDTKRIFITYPPTTSDDLANRVADKIKSICNFDEIIRSNAGCVISNHCGPECLGILFYRK